MRIIVRFPVDRNGENRATIANNLRKLPQFPPRVRLRLQRNIREIIDERPRSRIWTTLAAVYTASHAAHKRPWAQTKTFAFRRAVEYKSPARRVRKAASKLAISFFLALKRLSVYRRNDAITFTRVTDERTYEAWTRRKNPRGKTSSESVELWKWRRGKKAKPDFRRGKTFRQVQYALDNAKIIKVEYLNTNFHNSILVFAIAFTFFGCTFQFITNRMKLLSYD